MIRLLGWWMISSMFWFGIAIMTYLGAKKLGKSEYEANSQANHVALYGWIASGILMFGLRWAITGGW